MSLHATLDPAVIKRLRKQKRNSAATSILVAVLTLVLIGLLLTLLLLPQTISFNPEIVTYHAETKTEETIEKRQMTRAIERKPAAPSSSAAKAIATNTTSPIALPVPDTTVQTPSLDFGDGDDFGTGWDTGWDPAGGSGGGFGSPNKLLGSITGYLYDFKQTPEGDPIRSYDIANREHFTSRINRLHRSRFSPARLGNHYRTEQPLHVRYIAIPFSSASDGPRFFNAQKEIQPSGWIAHYRGKVTAPKSGTFRFVGAGDDYLSVMVDGKFRLVSAWSDIHSEVEVRGANARKQPGHQSPIGAAKLTYGDWFTVKQGEQIDVAITLGERPGGMVGFVLMLEEKGADYQVTPAGRPILPPFAMGPLSPEDINRLNTFPGWEWDTGNVPVFHAK